MNTTISSIDPASFAGPILMLHLAATLMMTGIIWFVQLVHYPLFSGVGRESFARYESVHQARTTWVVAPLMLIEMGTALLLLLARPAGIPLWQPAIGLGLLGILWTATFLIQVPCHTSLSRGFDVAIHRTLVTTNWIRTAGWTARAALVVGMLAPSLAAAAATSP